MMDGVELSEESSDLRTSITGEVGADPRLQIGGLSHVEHVAGGVGEPVDARTMREPDGKSELARLRVADQARQIEQLLELDDSEGSGPFE